MPVETHTDQVNTYSFPIDGMTCASCVGHVETAILAVKGATKADVNLATGQATVAFIAPATPELIRQPVRTQAIRR